MRKLSAILFPVVCVLQISAAGIGERWVLMPDSLCPYLTYNQRRDLLMKARAGIADTIKNHMEGTSYVCAYDPGENHMEVQVTPNLKWTLNWGIIPEDLLSAPQDAGMPEVPVYLTVTTELCAPRCAVTHYWYDDEWRLVKKQADPFETETEEEREPKL